MRIDHVHFYVEDAKEWRNWFISHLGFQSVTDCYVIPPVTLSTEGITDSLHTCTEVVKSGSVYFVLSSPYLSISPVAEYLRLHPPGVANVAFNVEDVEEAIAFVKQSGAHILQPLQQCQQGSVCLRWFKIEAWGSLTHTLLERRQVGEWQQREAADPLVLPSSPITAIDHIVLNVAAGDLKPAVTWYEKILDFQPQQTFKIHTDYSALYSQVMVSHNGSVQLPINEPASANSQIQEFLEVNNGPGIQHIALRTCDLVSAIGQFRAHGLSFLAVPQSYYHQLQQRPGFPLSVQELTAIAQQEILIDWCQSTPLGVKGTMPLLLQIFTQPIFGQPTFFFEFIQRRDHAQGFGEGNFRALFEAIEREQMKRGDLQDVGP